MSAYEIARIVLLSVVMLGFAPHGALGGAHMPLSKVECEICNQSGHSHKTYVGPYVSSTLLAGSPGYWDEAGVWHDPCDPNAMTRSYHCSNGHSWDITIRSDCH